MNLATRKIKMVKPPRDNVCWCNAAKNPSADGDNASSKSRSSSSKAFEGNTREMAFLTNLLLAMRWNRIAVIDNAAKYAGKTREFVQRLQKMRWRIIKDFEI
jgi:hypothetical protein